MARSFPWTAERLRFPPPLEEAYRTDYARRSILPIRVTLILSVALFLLFGLLDPYLIPGSYPTVSLVRYGIVTPLLAVFFGMTFFGFYKRSGQVLFLIQLMVIAGEILVFLALTRPDEPGRITHYA